MRVFAGPLKTTQWSERMVNLFCPGEEKHTMCEPQAQMANSGLIRTRVDLFPFIQTTYSRLNYSSRGS